MKDFTMSMYSSEKELYKAKAEYYENILKAIYESLEADGYGLWLPEWCVHEFEGNTETFTYEMLLNQLEVRVKKS